MNVSDRRAPGCEKKVVQIASADYEHKKLLATKAIQHKNTESSNEGNRKTSGHDEVLVSKAFKRGTQTLSLRA